jgi:hypothetical protein
MEVVRGQHRLRAAERLNVPIYYIVSDLLKNEDIAAEHESSKKWTLTDYVQTYATTPNPNQNSYRFIAQKHKETGIPFNTLANAYKGGHFGRNGSVMNTISCGNFKIQYLETGNNLVKKILDYDVLIGEKCKKVRFHSALARLMDNPNYKHDKFIAKIEPHHRDHAMKMPLNAEFDFVAALQYFYNKLMTTKINIIED